jgi:colicin import membrane protein
MKTLREYLDQLDEISRRDFLRGAGATAGLAAMGSAGVAKADDQTNSQLAQDKARAEQLARLRATAQKQQEIAQQQQKLNISNTENDGIEKEKQPHELSRDEARKKILSTIYANAIVRNIVFNPASVGNYSPAVTVGVSLAPDGTIMNYTVLQGSAFPEWDIAVLRGIEKTKVLPKDSDGKVPKQVRFTFRPK